MPTYLKHIILVDDIVKEDEVAVDALDDLHGSGGGTDVSEPDHVVEHDCDIVKNLRKKMEVIIFRIITYISPPIC